MDFKHAVGVGLRSAHFEDALKADADVDFVEVHAENYFADGGASLAVLREAAAQYPISLHGTGGGLASKTPIPFAHLRKLRQLVELTRPILISEHVAQTWFADGGVTRHAGDLLPIAFNEASLAYLVDNIQRTQDFLGRQILIENIAQYIRFQQSDMLELDFLVQACERTGCGLLVDLNNLYVNALNTVGVDADEAACQWVNQCPAYLVKQLHLAGSSDANNGLVIDDHAQPVSEPVWTLYRQAVVRFDRAATLIEWDEQLPSWPRLVQEAQRAKAIKNELEVAHASHRYVS